MRLHHKTTGTVLALAFVAASGLAFSAPVRAETVRSDCDGATCVRTYCDDDGYCTQRTISRSAYENVNRYRRERFACDADGDNCRWTRSYYFDADGNAIYDADMGQYP